MPASDFVADMYLLSVSNHCNGMVNFFNDFISNASTTDLYPIGSIQSKAFTDGSIRSCVENIFKYYYFILNEQIFPKIENDNDIDFSSFKKNFSNAVYERIDESEIHREFLYQNWDGEDNDISVFEDDMLDGDKAIPQFYKAILSYYDSEGFAKTLIHPGINIIRPHLQSSDLITLKKPTSKIEYGMTYFFTIILKQLACLPSEPDPYEIWEDMKKYSPNIPFKEDIFPKQFNSQYFDQLFNLMVDQTYQGTKTMQEVSETIL